MQRAKFRLLFPYLAGMEGKLALLCSIGELCELLNEYVSNDDSIHLILSRIIKNNNPNVNKDEKGNFINVSPARSNEL